MTGLTINVRSKKEKIRKKTRRDEYKKSSKKPNRRVPQYVRGVPRRPLRTVEKGLRKVYGVGRGKASEVRKACGRRKGVKVGNREKEEIQVRENWRRENVECGSDRRRKEYESRNRHMKLGTVRGINRRRGLPVRGQRTSTNGKTARRLNGKRRRKVG